MLHRLTLAFITLACLTSCCPSPDDERFPECLPATAEICESHPFGRAIVCADAGEREPQTSEKCLAVLDANPDLCETDYVECREAMRVAPCTVCPVECEGIAC